MDAKVSGVSRRQALRTGMYVAGAAWAAPAITVIGATAAHADSPSGSTPTSPPSTPPTDETPTPSPTDTPSPSDTPSPTDTPNPTDTPTPSGTSRTANPPAGSSSSPTVLGTHATRGSSGSAQAQSASGLGALPRTGTEVGSIGLLGAALVAGGVAAKVATHRRTDETDTPAN